MVSYTRINIAVLPPQKVLNESIRLSKEIAEQNKAYFILDCVHLFPHITLYSPEFPNKNIREVFEQVKGVCETRPFIAKFSTLRSHLGYVDISVQKTKGWTCLHASIANALNPLRENHLRAKYSEPAQLHKYTKKAAKIYQ